MLTTPTIKPFSNSIARPKHTRRVLALTGVAGAAAVLSGCGPHLRPGAGSTSGSRTITSDAKPGAPFLDSVRAPQAISTPVPTPQPVTIRPPDPNASGRLWFDPSPGPPPKDGAAYEMGFWRRASGRGYWHFQTLDPKRLSVAVIGPNDLPAQPPPPGNAGAFRVVHVQRKDADTAGYWVWNAGRFAGTTWAPRWEWVGDSRAHLLAA